MWQGKIRKPIVFFFFPITSTRHSDMSSVLIGGISGTQHSSSDYFYLSVLFQSTWANLITFLFRSNLHLFFLPQIRPGGGQRAYAGQKDMGLILLLLLLFISVIFLIYHSCVSFSFSGVMVRAKGIND